MGFKLAGFLIQFFCNANFQVLIQPLHIKTYEGGGRCKKNIQYILLVPTYHKSYTEFENLQVVDLLVGQNQKHETLL